VRDAVKYSERGERDLSISNFPIEGPGGVDRVASVLEDITDQKRGRAVAEVVPGADGPVQRRSGGGGS